MTIQFYDLYTKIKSQVRMINEYYHNRINSMLQQNPGAHQLKQTFTMPSQFINQAVSAEFKQFLIGKGSQDKVTVPLKCAIKKEPLKVPIRHKPISNLNCVFNLSSVAELQEIYCPICEKNFKRKDLFIDTHLWTQISLMQYQNLDPEGPVELSLHMGRFHVTTKDINGNECTSFVPQTLVQKLNHAIQPTRTMVVNYVRNTLKYTKAFGSWEGCLDRGMQVLAQDTIKQCFKASLGLQIMNKKALTDNRHLFCFGVYSHREPQNTEAPLICKLILYYPSLTIWREFVIMEGNQNFECPEMSVMVKDNIKDTSVDSSTSKIYIIGGVRPEKRQLGSRYCYVIEIPQDPTSIPIYQDRIKVTQIDQLPISLALGAGCCMNNAVYVMGGVAWNHLEQQEDHRYDKQITPNTNVYCYRDRWILYGSLASPRIDPTIYISRKESLIMLLGGYISTDIKYDNDQTQNILMEILNFNDPKTLKTNKFSINFGHHSNTLLASRVVTIPQKVLELPESQQQTNIQPIGRPSITSQKQEQLHFLLTFGAFLLSPYQICVREKKFTLTQYKDIKAFNQVKVKDYYGIQAGTQKRSQYIQDFEGCLVYDQYYTILRSPDKTILKFSCWNYNYINGDVETINPPQPISQQSIQQTNDFYFKAFNRLPDEAPDNGQIVNFSEFFRREEQRQLQQSQRLSEKKKSEKGSPEKNKNLTENQDVQKPAQVGQQEGVPVQQPNQQQQTEEQKQNLFNIIPPNNQAPNTSQENTNVLNANNEGLQQQTNLPNLQQPVPHVRLSLGNQNLNFQQAQQIPINTSPLLPQPEQHIISHPVNQLNTTKNVEAKIKFTPNLNNPTQQQPMLVQQQNQMQFQQQQPIWLNTQNLEITQGGNSFEPLGLNAPFFINPQPQIQQRIQSQGANQQNPIRIVHNTGLQSPTNQFPMQNQFFQLNCSQSQIVSGQDVNIVNGVIIHPTSQNNVGDQMRRCQRPQANIFHPPNEANSPFQQQQWQQQPNNFSQSQIISLSLPSQNNQGTPNLGLIQPTPQQAIKLVVPGQQPPGGNFQQPNQ